MTGVQTCALPIFYVIASADGTNMAMRNIMEGNMLCTGGSSPATLGSGVGQLIHMVFHDMFDANNLPEVTFAPNLLISKDNVDKYFIEDYDYAAPDPMVFQTVDEARAAILGE